VGPSSESAKPDKPKQLARADSKQTLSDINVAPSSREKETIGLSSVSSRQPPAQVYQRPQEEEEPAVDLPVEDNDFESGNGLDQIQLGTETPDIRLTASGQKPEELQVEPLEHELQILQKILAERVNKEGELRSKYSQQRKMIKDTFNVLRNALHEAEKSIVDRLNLNYDQFMDRVRNEYTQAENLYSKTRAMVNKRELSIQLQAEPQEISLSNVFELVNYK
jgi:hypothetical protein